MAKATSVGDPGKYVTVGPYNFGCNTNPGDRNNEWHWAKRAGDSWSDAAPSRHTYY